PVPAPPPTIGMPRCTMSRNFLRMSRRGIIGMTRSPPLRGAARAAAGRPPFSLPGSAAPGRKFPHSGIAIRLRRLYRIDMPVSGQVRSPSVLVEKGPRARMKRITLHTVMGLMQRGLIPSVSDVAEAAAVSRATAYRYFPSQAALIQETVDEALGPILEWTSASEDAEERVTELLSFGFPRIEEYEATHRAALLLAVDQWTRWQAGTLGSEERFVRGHRRALLTDAMKPLKRRLGKQAFDRAIQALSLIFGTETLVILKDIWGLEGGEVRRVAIWAAHALVRAATAEASALSRIGLTRATKKPAAKKTRPPLN